MQKKSPLQFGPRPINLSGSNKPTAEILLRKRCTWVMQNCLGFRRRFFLPSPSLSFTLDSLYIVGFLRLPLRKIPPVLSRSLSIPKTKMRFSTVFVVIFFYCSRHPSTKWAQKSDTVYITIELPDAKDVKLTLQPEGRFYFSATSGAENIPYELDLELLDKVDVDESKTAVGLRTICYLIKKAEKKWWSRLLKQEGKPPVYLKVDWDKWIDEDDEKENKFGGMNFDDMDFSVDDDEDAGEAKPNGEERAENAQTATTGEPENKA
ncbi:hypothetical protein ZIOFF_045092 [Zingiber officinale]|uniref:Co-chaperone protein p23 n=1 Tax=Zingiber officinale TaxID=94328 RepID=A0A8J5KXX5_ZINOF|nr:hypothetical protein ZIOFF_045092 [Zingiber officinale]